MLIPEIRPTLDVPVLQVATDSDSVSWAVIQPGQMTNYNTDIDVPQTSVLLWPLPNRWN